MARRLGIAAATLRTWDRRYGVGPSAHVGGTRRQFSPPDVARLDAMQRLIRDGVAPADAAAHASGLSLLAARELSALPAGESVRRRPEALTPASGGGPGGRVLALRGGTAESRGLARAATNLNGAAVRAAVRVALEQHGLVGAWEHVLCPVLVAAGERWAANGDGVDVEHLLSAGIIAEVRRHAGDAPEPVNGRPVLLACAPDERHDLPLHVLAAALAHCGVGCRELGAALPAEALRSAVRRTGPAVVLVWAQLRATGDPGVVAGLPGTRPRTQTLVAGPGWDPSALPASVALAHRLPEAVDLVLAGLGY